MSRVKSFREQAAQNAKQAREIAEKAQAEGRDLTAAEAKEFDELATKAIRANESAKKAEEDDRITAQAKAFFASIGGFDGKDGSQMHLNLKNIGAQLADQMVAYSRRMQPESKGLVPSGEVILTSTLANGNPIPEALSLEHAPRLIDMITVQKRDTPAYGFLKQTVVASPGGASVVAPGDTKPTKKLGIERVDDRLRVVAVLSEPIDKYLLADMANLKLWVATQLSEAILDTLETEVLTGDGTGEHFIGLANASGIQTQAYQTDKLVTLQYGISKLENYGIAPQIVALASDDWLTIQTTRNSSGSFDVGGPIDATARTAWGTKVVVVPSLTAGTGYIIGQDTVNMSTDTGNLQVEWGTPGDAFTKNQIVARVEGRFNLDVQRPHGIVQLSLTSA
jgi:HK97 family phage major capsid protein